MSYSEQVRPGKNMITGDDIASGSISLRHLDPGLFSEFRQIQLHTHTGVKSSRVRMTDLTGSFPKEGIYIRSTNGTMWRITVSDAGALQAVAA